jgi:hypothetical protein
MSSMRAVAVVCANGLGHFRRTLEVLQALERMEPGLRLDIVCEKWQRERMGAWATARNLENNPSVGWIHGLMEPGPRWCRDAAEYGDGRLRDWIRRIESSGILASADLVLSDNLAGVLELRPDTVLMGSFLWSDVLEEAHPENARVSEFVDWERRLLADCRPPMLCVGALAMPGVVERTQAVPLPWMRTGAGRPDIRRKGAPRSTPRVAVLIGATGAADSLAADIATSLLARGAEVSLPLELFERLAGRVGAHLFRFEDADFLACDLALCRPGLGAIHDCLYYGLPMALTPEAFNAEMRHNGLRIESLGLGIYLHDLRDPGEIAGRILEFSATEAREGILENMAGQVLDGIDKAAQWLRVRLRSP